MFNLKPPQSIFVHADGFLKAANYLNAPQPNGAPMDPLCFAALVTNSAFASELYLKCLIQLDSGQQVIKEHNLRKLFAKLTPATQKDLESRFDLLLAKQPAYDESKMTAEMRDAASKRPTTFRETLRSGADAFTEWRYLYENDGFSNPFGLFPLPSLLRTVILERQPEWGQFVVKMEKIADAVPIAI
jgi:HEPN domain-containing protein